MSDLQIDLSDLGACCRCDCPGNPDNPVRTIVSLPHKAPIAGHGWGCVVCGLPPDGAQAAVCDVCAEEMHEDQGPHAGLRWAWQGYPGEGRTPISSLAGSHEHDLTRHPEIQSKDEG